MKTKQIGTDLPGAWIINPKDKGRKSIKSGNIYLDNNENFEIEVYNPLKECVLADIRLNNQSISKTGLVIKPGQRIYLDCFIDDKKKFTFQTYNVEDSNATRESITNNGMMEVFFYKEEVVLIKNWPIKYREYYPIFIDRYPNYTTIGGYYGSTAGFTLYSSNTTTSTTSSTFAPNLDYINLTNGTNKIETGRVEKGEQSQQEFKEINMDFEKNYINHIVYQLLPSSRKPAEVTTKPPNDGLKVTELLIKLKDLKDNGVITNIEFEEKKKELLSRI